MFYCEIDKNGFCYHVTKNELPLSENIILSDKDVLGMTYDSETGGFSEYVQSTVEQIDCVNTEEINEDKLNGANLLILERFDKIENQLSTLTEQVSAMRQVLGN